MRLRIKEVLREQKTTATSLADKIGIAQPSMSNIVNGNATPSLERLEQIADALNVPITELFETPAGDVVSCPYCGGKIKVGKE
jgi:transcriptional regulator with XRE-family HTH domain